MWRNIKKLCIFNSFKMISFRGQKKGWATHKLVSFRGLIQNSWRASLPLSYGSLLPGYWGGGHVCMYVPVGILLLNLWMSMSLTGISSVFWQRLKAMSLVQNFTITGLTSPLTSPTTGWWRQSDLPKIHITMSTYIYLLICWIIKDFFDVTDQTQY